jgi:hypothetical protein
VEDVADDDEVEGAAELELPERAETPLSDAAPAAEALDRVRTRLDADVAEARAHPLQVRAPRPFPAPDVEHRADRTVQEGLGDPDDELAPGTRAVSELLGGVAYLEAYTTADAIEGDRRAWHHRAPATYRRLFRRAGLTGVGMHCWVGPGLASQTAALERT